MDFDSFLIGMLFTIVIVLLWQLRHTLIQIPNIFSFRKKPKETKREGCPECGSPGRHKKGCSMSKEGKK